MDCGDVRGPILAFSQPAAGAILTTPSPQIDLTYQDEESGVDEATLQITLGGAPLAVTCSFTGSSASCTPDAPLADGVMSLEATIADTFGNVSDTALLTFSVDTTPPTIAFTQPAAGAILTDHLPEIRLAYDDAVSGVDTGSVTIGRSANVPGLDCVPGPTETVCDPTGAIGDGLTTLTATVQDLAGHLSGQAALEFTVDTVPPTLSILTPLDGVTIGTQLPRIRVAFGDTTSGADPSTLVFTVDGQGLVVTCSFVDSYAECTPVSPMAEGERVLLASIEDLAGHLSQAQSTFTVDLSIPEEAQPPVISFLVPRPYESLDPTVDPFRVLFGDSGMGVDTASLQVLANGQALSLSCTVCATYADCVSLGPVNDTVVTMEATVADLAGNMSAPAQVTFTTEAGGELEPPTIRLITPEPDSVTNERQQVFRGSLSEPGQLTLDGSPVALDSQDRFEHAVTLSEGVNSFVLVAEDLAFNQSTLTLEVTLDTEAPDPVDGALVTVFEPVAGVIAVVGASGSVNVSEPGLAVAVTNTLLGTTVSAAVQADGSFSASLAGFAQQQVSVVVVDAAGNRSPPRLFAVPGTLADLPDPATIAPPVDTTDGYSLFEDTRFLYEGGAPIQIGVVPGAIEAHRVALLRGRLVDEQGNPASGVGIAVADHPELGGTLTRADGWFDLVVNGGEPLTLRFRSGEFLPMDRTAEPMWLTVEALPECVLTRADSQITNVDPASASTMTVAQGTAVADGSGSRQATLLFPAGVAAQATFEGGSSAALGALDVRATEYTVGARGPEAMPAELPPSSLYTYAVDFSVDEALDVGATGVVFDQPVISYTENFIGLPVGSNVPVGYYDREKETWIGAENGRVIEILGVTANLADLDVDGSGLPADAATLAELGITDDERQQLATLYPVGETLWRIQVEHFTAYDFNYAGLVPEGAESPDEDSPKGGDQDTKNKGCNEGGSIIECENQILREVVAVTGTPYTLNYSSGRVPGRTAALQLDVPLSGAQVPADVERIDLEVNVAGRRIVEGFDPLPDQSHTFTWDGLDPYGRPVQGRVPYEVRVGHVYSADYAEPPDDCESCFAIPGTTAVTPAARRGHPLAEPPRPDGSLGRAPGLPARRLEPERAPSVRSGRADPLPGRRHPAQDLRRQGDQPRRRQRPVRAGGQQRPRGAFRARHPRRHRGPR